MLPGRDENGMTPTTYETEVFAVPDDLKGTFVKDEAFDEFTSSIVVAWLSYINTNSLAPLLHARPLGNMESSESSRTHDPSATVRR
jgi:hypothetical protein